MIVFCLKGEEGLKCLISENSKKEIEHSVFIVIIEHFENTKSADPYENRKCGKI